VRIPPCSSVDRIGHTRSWLRAAGGLTGLTVEEVDPVHAESGALTLAEAGAGGEDDEGSTAVRTCVCHLLDLGGGQRHDLAVLALGERDPVARDAPISWSPTAALKMARPIGRRTSTDPGASTSLRPFTQAWTSLRRIAPSGR